MIREVSVEVCTDGSMTSQVVRMIDVPLPHFVLTTYAALDEENRVMLLTERPRDGKLMALYEMRPNYSVVKVLFEAFRGLRTVYFDRTPIHFQ